MPRPKRSLVTAKQKASKRWCPNPDLSKSNVSSDNVPKQNERLSNLIDLCTSTGEIKNEVTVPQYAIVDINQLSEFFENVLCKSCMKQTLSISFGEKLGLSVKMELFCSNCSANKKVCSSKTIVQKNEKIIDINRRVVQTFMSIGKGYAALRQFCMLMNLDLMSSRTFNNHKKKLCTTNRKLFEEHIRDICSKVKDAYQCDNSKNVLDIGVSFDGTWLTRGHSSQIGVGCVIDIFTGFVLDCQIMSKRCIECEKASNELGEKSPEFDVWYSGHLTSCSINHRGSSAAMEQEAALKLWKRSKELGFRYVTILSDGDAKTFTYLNEKKVYDVEIKKEECVNHVSKRLGTALRNTVKEWRSRGVTLGGKSHGSLKEETIKKLTRYYQNAILRNKGDVKGMKTAIYATLFHSISTDNKPQHSKCPPGDNSWCFFQSAIAKNQKPGSHKKNVNTPLNEAHLSKILPVYQRLAADDLLKRCIRCATQNANESLHSVIWSKCSKQTSASLRRVNVAVCDAVMEFNVGTYQHLKMLEKATAIPISSKSVAVALFIDKRRVYFRKRRNNVVANLARQKIRLAIKRRNANKIKKEGITYQAGGF